MFRFLTKKTRINPGSKPRSTIPSPRASKHMRQPTPTPHSFW